jgi:hypothetical protein
VCVGVCVFGCVMGVGVVVCCCCLVVGFFWGVVWSEGGGVVVEGRSGELGWWWCRASHPSAALSPTAIFVVLLLAPTRVH